MNVLEIGILFYATAALVAALLWALTPSRPTHVETCPRCRALVTVADGWKIEGHAAPSDPFDEDCGACGAHLRFRRTE